MTEKRVRKAKLEDMIAVWKMIQELADFQGMPNGPTLTIQDLINDAGFNSQKEYFHCYIVEIKKKSYDDSTSTNGLLTWAPIGYSICHFTYSTWQGKSYFIEDIYVKPEYRKKGFGVILLKEIFRIAINEYNCCRIDLHVLEYNPTKEFYENLGAINFTTTDKWNFYRFEKQQIEKILNK